VLIVMDKARTIRHGVEIVKYLGGAAYRKVYS